MSTDSIRKPIRWWPLWFLVLAIAGALAFIWVLDENRPTQAKFLRSVYVGLGTIAFFLLWLVVFSRARWQVRASVIALFVLLCVAAKLSLEIRGVTGDLFPILAFRWTPKNKVTAVPVREAATNAWKKVSGEFLEFYGPQRNAVLPDAHLETNWSAHPPKILWRTPVGAAWSGFAVRDGLAITQEQREEKECVVCYEVVSGKIVWMHSDPAKYSTTIAGEGPRATPTISSNRVYTFGATGLLNCLDFRSGKRIWSKDTARENNADVGDWGLTSSPLVVDGKLVVSIGGSNNRSLVAYDADNGTFVWGAGNAEADYSSPVLAPVLGTRQIVIFNGFGVVAHDLDGKKLWDYPWKGGHPHITPPLLVGTNEFLVSSGYGTGAELLRIERTGSNNWSAQRVWKSLAMKSKFGPLLRVGEYVYGLDDGMMACVEIKTGERRWKDGRYGHGQGLVVGDEILFATEKGEIILIEPSPERLIELGKIPLFTEKVWNPPSLAGEYLLARNHKEAACLQLKVRAVKIANVAP